MTKILLKDENFLKKLAMIAGVFSFIVCILLIINYIQFKKADPLNSAALNTLVERFYQNPDDDKLRDEIRTLDLLARKAYFTQQWQIRTGGYLFLAGIIIMLIALQIIEINKKKKPSVFTKNAEDFEHTRKKKRLLVGFSGGVLIIITIIISYLSHKDIGNKFEFAAKQSAVSSQQSAVTDQPLTSNTDNHTPTSELESLNSEPKTPNTELPTPNSQLPTPVNADNFPMFRGPGGYGISLQKNIPISWDGASGKNILWKTPIPLPGKNSPVIWNDKVFLTGANANTREVYCFDKNTGKILWIVPVKDIPRSPTASPKVTEDAGFAASTAATDGNAVYAIFPNGDLIAIDFSGKIIWSLNFGMPQNHYGYSSSLAIYKDMVIVQYDQKTSPRLIALSAKTGKTIWSTARKVKISWSSPIVVNTGKRTEIIVAAEPYVASYNPYTGEELWKIDCIYGEVAPSLAYSNGIVFSINDNSKLSAIKLGDKPEVIWESTDYLSEIPSPVANNKYLFVPTGYGVVVCYDNKTGTQYWEKDFNNHIYSSPVIVEGKVYMLDGEGKMHIFKADKEYISIGEAKLGEKTFATPAFSDGNIYIRGEKHLYCIGK